MINVFKSLVLAWLIFLGLVLYLYVVDINSIPIVIFFFGGVWGRLGNKVIGDLETSVN